MNKLALEKRVQILTALAEGCSMRSTARMVSVSINTVVKLLIEAGKSCARYHHEAMWNLPCQYLQVDEIWSFCRMKDRNIPDERRGEYGIGDVWTWTALDAETKLIASYLVGLRDLPHARVFMDDIASRLAGRVQLTSDGLKVYVRVVKETFGTDIDYAQLVKVYGTDPLDDRVYSPSICLDCIKTPQIGNPNPDHISTSFVERQNLSMRMRMRRFTRLTNAFSKKIENLEHAVALYFMHYNFVCPHQTLSKEAGRKMTPAMAAGVTDHRWTMEDLLAMIDRLSQNEFQNP